MRKAIAWVLLAGCTSTAPVAVTSLASAPRPRPIPARTTAPGTLRLASYNVNFGIAGDPSTVAAVERAAPDVVVFQETNDVWRDALIAGLPRFTHHVFVPPSDLPAGGMGVLSIYPIRSVEQLPSQGGPFFALRIVVETPLGAIQILDVHLRPPMSDGGSWVAGFSTTRGVREREMAYHVERLDPKLPTVIAGDFNEEVDGLAVAIADRRGFTDAVSQYAGKTRSWEWPVGDLTLRFQLDHILYDTRLVATAGGIVEAGRSDHKPVWADLELVPP